MRFAVRLLGVEVLAIELGDPEQPDLDDADIPFGFDTPTT